MFLRGDCRVSFISGDRVNILWWNRNFVQPGLTRHALVAVGVIGRHVALITPKYMNLIPGQLLSGDRLV